MKRIELVFTPNQWETYRRRVTANSRKDFDLSVGINGSGELVRATAHFRGQTTFRCNRRNYTLNLYGKRSAALLDDSPTDEYYFLSLCRDYGYVAQHTVLQLWRELGLFPLEFEYVELRLNGHSRGLYLMVEKLERLRFSRLDIHGLFRRGFAGGRTQMELKYARGRESEEISAFEAAFDGTDELAGEALVAAFEEHMDVDQYLLWLATNTLLQNGDSVDELWLIVERRAGPYYRFAGWDPEDVFRPCHNEDKFAFDDPNGLVYCAEAEWDALLLSDPVGYGRYVDVLEDLIRDRLTEAHFERALAVTESELTRYLARPEISDAMREGGDSLPKAVDAIESMRESFRHRRDTLLERLDRYRSVS